MDAPISSYHGTNDFVVPIGVGISGGAISSFGSDPIHQRAQNLSIPNYLKRVIVGSHTGIYVGSNAATFLAFLDSTAYFYKTQVLCPSISGTFDNIEDQKLSIYPNPALDHIWIKGLKESDYELFLFDIYGKIQLVHIDRNSGPVKMNVSNLSKGFYFLNISDDASREVRKILIK